MAGISFTETGLKQARADVSRSEKVARDTRILHKDASIQLGSWITRNFKKDGKGHDDTKFHWPDLADITKEKRRGSEPFKILDDTARLKTGFEHNIGSDKLVIQNKVPYASKHEFGEGRIPQRKILPTEKQAEGIFKKIVDHFLKTVTK